MKIKTNKYEELKEFVNNNLSEILAKTNNGLQYLENNRPVKAYVIFNEIFKELEILKLTME